MKILSQIKLTCQRPQPEATAHFGEYHRIPKWMSSTINDTDTNKPYAHLSELQQDVEIKIELAGIVKNSLQVTVNNNWLSVSGEKTIGSSGSFNLDYKLPINCDKTSLIMNYAEGVLYLYLNKEIEESKSKPHSFSLMDIFSIFQQGSKVNTDHKAS